MTIINSNKQPLVSVIVNCFNGEEYLDYAIASVLNQTYHNFEIIFWDNQSQDKSSKKINSYNDSRIKYFYSKEHTLLGEARNLAIDCANGELLAFLDIDDTWEKDKLEKQVPLFNNDRTVLVYCDSFSFNNKGTKKLLSQSKKFYKGKCFKNLLLDYFLVMSSTMVRKKALEENKIRFNIDFEMVEEADVFIRLAYLGEIDFVNKPLANWRSHNKSETWKKFHLLYKESQIMINNLIKIYPEISIQYVTELLAYNNWLLKQKILSYWMDSDNILMRKTIYDNYSKLSFFQIISFYSLSFIDSNKWASIIFKIKSSIVHPDS